MTAYEGGPETVLLRREMGGNEGKDVQRNTVYGSERVLPLVDTRQRRRCIPAKLRNLVESEATGQVSVLPSLAMIFRNVRCRMDCVLQLLVESEDELGGRQALSRVSSRVHEEDEERWKEIGFSILRKRSARRDARSFNPAHQSIG